MNKSKVVNKNGASEIIIKGQKGQQISQREAYAINNNQVEGLLRFELERRGSSFRLCYNTTGFITFRKYLEAPIDRSAFARILQNILRVLKSMQAAYIGQQYLLMDFDKIMVNPSTQRLFFIGVPIQNFDGGKSLREFLLEIIQVGRFVAYEDNGYVAEYIRILNSGVNFSVFELEQYIQSLFAPEVEPVKEMECPFCRARVPEDSKYCPGCGNRIGGNTDSFSSAVVYDPLNMDKEGIGAESIGIVPQDPMTNASTHRASDGTDVLRMEEIPGTTVLGSEELDAPVRPYLIQRRGQKKIPIDVQVFTIGKAPENYFQITGNTAISRKHAEIFTRGRRYYIRDHSLNGTYVDGRKIGKDKDVEIFSGTRLRFANEDFIFYVDT